MLKTEPGTNKTTPTGATAAELLPDMDSRPDADIVIFDGDCNFCRSQVQKLHWFSMGKLAFVSLHDPRVGERFSDLSHDQLMEQMYVVTPGGQRYAGAEALRYLSLRFPRLWFAAPLLHVPFSLPLWQFLYRQVARMRYRLAGKSSECQNDACKIHFD